MYLCPEHGYTAGSDLDFCSECASGVVNVWMMLLLVGVAILVAAALSGALPW